MEYMLIITADESDPAPYPGQPGFDEMMEGWAEYTRRLMSGGHWLNGASLMPSTTATTVRKTPDAAPAVIDGPFAETKEQLAGYYTITAPDLDTALELATAMPIQSGSIEVRPIAVRPEASDYPEMVQP
jgi:hypothetical protein